jgi:hypothetical protein
MPLKNRENEEQIFNDAFDDAAKENRETVSADAVDERSDASRAQADDETAERDEAAEDREDADESKQSAGESENTEEIEPDYKELYQREVQRFKSFEGRYRKEKQAWERERRELTDLLQRETGAAHSPAADLPDTEVAAANRREPENAAASDARPLNEVVRQEAKRLMEPLVAAMEADRHRNAVAAVHPDFEQLAGDPDLHAWIDEQPDYIARSLRDVVDRGTSDEVIDLLDRYKQDRGRKTARAKAEQNKAKAARKAQEATAVRSRSAGPPKDRPSAEDFAGAWAEAVQKGL